MDFYDDDADWKPPSAAELAELERRRERGNKVVQYSHGWWQPEQRHLSVYSDIETDGPVYAEGLPYVGFDVPSFGVDILFWS